eukprot:scaffold131_cov55-Attheya_sp.AAC.7
MTSVARTGETREQWCRREPPIEFGHGGCQFGRGIRRARTDHGPTKTRGSAVSNQGGATCPGSDTY